MVSDFTILKTGQSEPKPERRNHVYAKLIQSVDRRLQLALEKATIASWEKQSVLFAGNLLHKALQACVSTSQVIQEPFCPTELSPYLIGHYGDDHFYDFHRMVMRSQRIVSCLFFKHKALIQFEVHFLGQKGVRLGYWLATFPKERCGKIEVLRLALPTGLISSKRFPPCLA